MRYKEFANKNSNFKHGHSSRSVDGKVIPTSTYNSWASMIQRCHNSQNYVGRGITVCKHWLGRDGFIHFLKDMGECPEDYSIERIDNDGNYNPSNCKWIPRGQQNWNKRTNKLKCWDVLNIKAFAGFRILVKDIALMYQCSYATIRNILNNRIPQYLQIKILVSLFISSLIISCVAKEPVVIEKLVYPKITYPIMLQPPLCDWFYLRLQDRDDIKFDEVNALVDCLSEREDVCVENINQYEKKIDEINKRGE